MVRYYQHICEPGVMRRVLKRTQTHITFDALTAVFGYFLPVYTPPQTIPVKGSQFTSRQFFQGKHTERRWNDYMSILEGSAED